MDFAHMSVFVCMFVNPSVRLFSQKHVGTKFKIAMNIFHNA